MDISALFFGQVLTASAVVFYTNPELNSDLV
jgi:hypothetical protein